MTDDSDENPLSTSAKGRLREADAIYSYADENNRAIPTFSQWDVNRMDNPNPALDINAQNQGVSSNSVQRARGPNFKRIKLRQFWASFDPASFIQRLKVKNNNLKGDGDGEGA